MTVVSRPSRTSPEAVAALFRQVHGAAATLIARAPGRVNMIGEHTDYNDGYVMPAALQLCTWIAAGPRVDRVLKVTSAQYDDTVELDLGGLQGPARHHWSDYIRGIAAVLKQAGHELNGANLVIVSDVPLGAGLSSSASLETATALALSHISRFELPRREMVFACQRAEHEFVGTRCGIMDQFISAYGEAGHLLLLDCRTLEDSLLPLAAGVDIVIVNSLVKHDLAASEYNLRRAACETGVKVLAKSLPGITALRDVTSAQLDAYQATFPETIFHRCRHVITENQRVLNAGTALQSNDLRTFGQLMYASHRSLREDYEVSCPELDFLVNTAARISGVYGARMTGGGFGGCTVNLVESGRTGSFIRVIEEEYEHAFGITPVAYICSAEDGAGIVWEAGE